MPVKLARGVITPNQRYVCLSCHVQSLSFAGGRATRYQHTGRSEHDGGDKTQESVSKGAGSHEDAASRSRIGDIIRSFMFKSDANDKETKDDSRMKSLGGDKVNL